MACSARRALACWMVFRLRGAAETMGLYCQSQHQVSAMLAFLFTKGIHTWLAAALGTANRLTNKPNPACTLEHVIITVMEQARITYSTLHLQSCVTLPFTSPDHGMSTIMPTVEVLSIHLPPDLFHYVGLYRECNNLMYCKYRCAWSVSSPLCSRTTVAHCCDTMLLWLSQLVHI